MLRSMLGPIRAEQLLDARRHEDETSIALFAL